MKILNILMIPIVSLFVGCGTSVDDETFDIEKINAQQEKMQVEVSQSEDSALPENIRNEGRGDEN